MYTYKITQKKPSLDFNIPVWALHDISLFLDFICMFHWYVVYILFCVTKLPKISHDPSYYYYFLLLLVLILLNFWSNLLINIIIYTIYLLCIQHYTKMSKIIASHSLNYCVHTLLEL